MKRGVMIAGALVVSLWTAAPAMAADFTVTRSDDPAPGACAAGDCSLREAVSAANAATTDDRVLLGARTASLTTGAIEVENTGALTILGQGAANSVIDAGGLSRVIEGADNGVNLVLESLTLRRGKLVGPGGGVQLLSDSALTVRNSTFSDNEGELSSGGAIQLNSENTLTVTNSTFVGNRSTNGGAIQVNSDVTTTITGSTFSGNNATNSGGAVQVNTPGTITVQRSRFTGNTANNSGGALQTNSDVITTISDSTFDGNRAVGPGGDGGALQINTGVNAFTVTNSTFTGNRAEDGGGSSGRGGAIQVNGGKVSTLNNVTIAGNTATGPASVGGGIETGVPASITFRNTIIASNTAATATNCSGPYISGGFNLESADTCGLGAAELRNTNPLLKPLADNGGPTQTMAFGLPAPVRGPAIDAGDPAGSCAPTDQRGVPRKGDRCDIGAYELERCGGIVVNRVGSSAADTLLGTTGADGFLLLGGNDSASGGKGKDGICGNAGNDVLRGGAGPDSLKGGAGKDRLFGQGGVDSLSGGRKKDLCSGGKNGKGKDKAKGCERTRGIP